jgi:hypothetical protein
MALVAEEEEVIINDEVLLTAITSDEENREYIESYGSSDLVGLVPVVTSLKLPFSHLSQIKNIDGFYNLKKLCLDNNNIKEIKNLSHLVHLEWLDLSFNQIQRIEGLESLTKLKDLSLFANEISDVGTNLLPCAGSLECLSLGNNQLESLDQILKLRPLGLKMVSLSGNPLTEEPDYQATALAFLPNLRYLDFRQVRPEEVEKAIEGFQDELIDLQDKEGVEKERKVKEEQQNRLLSDLSEKGVAFTLTTFEFLFSSDPDLKKLLLLPGMNDVVEATRQEFRELGDRFVEAGGWLFEQKEALTNKFNEDMAYMESEGDGSARECREEFYRFYKRFLDRLRAKKEYDDSDRKELEAQLEEVNDLSMQGELRRSDIFQELVDAFESSYNELKNRALDMQQQYFRAAETLQADFNKSAKALAGELVEKLAKEEISDALLEEEAVILLSDLESCNNTVNNSHELHVTRLIKKEDDERMRELQLFTSMFDQLREAESSRNRNRVTEIFEFTFSIKREVEQIITPLRDEDEDEY